MQCWIDNFDTVTTAAILANDYPLLSTILSPVDYARFEAACGATGWCELTLVGGSGAIENLRAWPGGSIYRDLADIGSTPAWPAGTRVIVAVTTSAAARFHASCHMISTNDTDQLELAGLSEAWSWYPPAIVTPVIVCTFAQGSPDLQAVNTVVELGSPNLAAPLDLVLVGLVPDCVKLPSGAVGSYVQGDEEWHLTLPAANSYLLTFKSIATRTLEVSDFSEYSLTV